MALSNGLVPHRELPASLTPPQPPPTTPKSAQPGIKDWKRAGDTQASCPVSPASLLIQDLSLRFWVYFAVPTAVGKLSQR